MDSRLRGNDREEMGNDMRIRELHREIRNDIKNLLKEVGSNNNYYKIELNW